MLNTYNKTLVSNHVNAVTGNITKTYKDSYFKRFHLKSSFADNVLSYGGSTVVIQVVVVGDMEVIAELINKNDYDKLFESV